MRAPWLLWMMKMDRTSIHSHPCVPSGLKQRLVAHWSSHVTVSNTQNKLLMLYNHPAFQGGSEADLHGGGDLVNNFPRFGARTGICSLYAATVCIYECFDLSVLSKIYYTQGHRKISTISPRGAREKYFFSFFASCLCKRIKPCSHIQQLTSALLCARLWGFYMPNENYIYTRTSSCLSGYTSYIMQQMSTGAMVSKFGSIS